ncbi:MAG TPA: RusA family crossover junction endodeoxyribonuclease [Thermomicrobiales bacterium]|nr:RusA family crossover junction endodeoxyribonuclease [Thermomicrobiales bacterium]
MGTLRLTLPLPPSINSQYVTVGRRRVLSKEAKSFKSDVRKLIDRLRTSGKLPVQIEAGLQGSLLGVYMTFHFETPFRRDLDGGLKIALDSLAEALGFDDRMVVDIHLIKQMDTLNPRLEVEIETIADWQFDPQYVLLGHADEASSEDGQALE